MQPPSSFCSPQLLLLLLLPLFEFFHILLFLVAVIYIFFFLKEFTKTKDFSPFVSFPLSCDLF